jgi:hypothetical protein
VKVYTHATINIDGKDVPKGSFVDILEYSLPELTGKVAYIKNGQLHVPRFVESLESLIAGLTSDDLVEQKRLLLLHCLDLSSRNIVTKWKEWEKRVAAMVNEGISRDEAEVEAARKLNLLAFLDERRVS